MGFKQNEVALKLLDGAPEVVFLDSVILVSQLGNVYVQLSETGNI